MDSISTEKKLGNSLPKIIDQAIDCHKHGAYTVRAIEGFPPKCPGCRAESEEAEEKTQKQKQDQREQAMRQRKIDLALRSAMLPLRFREKNFENFSAKTEDQKIRKRRCEEYAEDFEDKFLKGVSMILCGGTGTGKTHLACSIANFVILNHARPVAFLSVMDAIRCVKETYSKKCDRTELQAIKSFLEPDLLVLDEIGVQFGSDAEKMILFEIINKRYENLKPTILISNLAPKFLSDFVGERIMDRMKENGGKILTFEWASHRRVDF